MSNISIGNLFNMVELHHIIRNAPVMYWLYETVPSGSTYHVLSNGYMVWRFALPEDSPTLAIIRKRFNDYNPDAFPVLRSQKARKRYDVDEFNNRDALLSLLWTQGRYDIVDTGITADMDDSFDPDKRQIHAFCVSCADAREYVFINQKYRDCIYQPDGILAVSANSTSPLIFESATTDERAVILPVNTDPPAFLAPLN